MSERDTLTELCAAEEYLRHKLTEPAAGRDSAPSNDAGTLDSVETESAESAAGPHIGSLAQYPSKCIHDRWMDEPCIDCEKRTVRQSADESATESGWDAFEQYLVEQAEYLPSSYEGSQLAFLKNILAHLGLQIVRQSPAATDEVIVNLIAQRDDALERAEGLAAQVERAKACIDRWNASSKLSENFQCDDVYRECANDLRAALTPQDRQEGR